MGQGDFVNISGTTKYYLYNGHGDVVQLSNSSGAIIKTYHYDAYGNELKAEQAKYGDVDGNGYIDNTDVSIAMSYSVGSITSFPCEYGLTAADVDGNGTFSIADAITINQYVSGSISIFSVDTKLW